MIKGLPYFDDKNYCPVTNLKNWLETRVTDQSSDADFFQGTEATTANSSNWNSTINLQGGARKILWDARMSDIPMKLSISGNVTISGNMTFS